MTATVTPLGLQRAKMGGRVNALGHAANDA